MNRKNVWIINQYGSTPETGMGGRCFYFSKELSNIGHKVTMISGTPHHLLRDYFKVGFWGDIEQRSNFQVLWLKLFSYSGAHSILRGLNWFLFSFKLAFVSKRKLGRPDVVFVSSPSPFSFIGAMLIAKRYNAKLIIDIRDIWPLTLKRLGGYSDKNPLVRLMSFIERKAYRGADHITSNLIQAFQHVDRINGRKKNFTWLPNGIDVDEVSNSKPLDSHVDSLFPNSDFVVGYAGTLGVANSIDTLIDAAALLENHSQISFVIVGDGKEKERLVQKVKSLKLNNVTFINSVSKNQVQSVLNVFDACFLGWNDSSLYEFGIGANKIPEYMYSGTPILHSFSGNGDPIDKYGCGLTVKAEDPVALRDGVLKLFNMNTDQRESLGAKGRKTAIEIYDYKKIAEKLASIF